MYHTFRNTHVITSSKFKFKQTRQLMKAIANMKLDTEETIKLEWVHKVDSECELNSWPDSSVG